jgi:hypothetical protein
MEAGIEGEIESRHHGPRTSDPSTATVAKASDDERESKGIQDEVERSNGWGDRAVVATASNSPMLLDPFAGYSSFVTMPGEQ